MTQKVIGVQFLLALLAVCFASTLAKNAAAKSHEINLYSYRQPAHINDILTAFTQKSKIKVNVIYAKRGMLRLINAAKTPADAILTEDIGRLVRLDNGGILTPVRSKILETNIPRHLRSPESQWFALTIRARVAVVSRKRVKNNSIKSYMDFTHPKYKGRVCIRSLYHPYNIALVASIIAHKGEAAAEKWLLGVRKNLAREPHGGDRSQIKAIYNGICDIALVNNYYLGRMATNHKKPERKKWSKAVQLVYLDQDNHGQHINITGAAVATTARNPDGALKLIEYLSSVAAQHQFAAINHEYPVHTKVTPSKLVRSWGDFKADSIPLSIIAKHRTGALLLVNDLGF